MGKPKGFTKTLSFLLTLTVAFSLFAMPISAMAAETGADSADNQTTVTDVTVADEGSKQPSSQAETDSIKTQEKKQETEESRTQGFENKSASLKAELIGRYHSGVVSEDGGSTEIVAYNSENGYAYVVNGATGNLAGIRVSELSEAFPNKVNEMSAIHIPVKEIVKANAEDFDYGDMTSVAVSFDGKLLAAALQAKDYTENGRVAIFDCEENGDLSLKQVVSVGVQPDMVTFTPDGKKILTANEGEPRMGYTAQGAVDPKGSVSIISASDFTVTTRGFEEFDAEREALTAKGVVIKKDTAPSVDFEPEYIACTETFAYVSLQEANAIAVLSLSDDSWKGIYSAGFEDYSQVAIDINKGDKAYAPETYENVKGIRMPDGISAVTIDKVDYILTANEGDGRAWPVDGETDTNEMKDKKSPTGNIQLDKKVTWFDHSGYDGLEENVDYLFGSRSFTMFRMTEEGLTEVFDSKSDFEEKTNEYLPDYFNCSNDDLDKEDRSGKKGPEPETVTVGKVGKKTYAFIALERIGGIMMYDITNPDSVSYVNYINSRDFKAAIGDDDSPEGLCFVGASESPTKKAMLLAACEVGGTVAAYELTEKASSGSSGSSSSGSSSSGSSSGNKNTDKKDETRDETKPEEETSKTDFADVSPNAYYADAVAWAVKKGITSGMSETTFGPDNPCTRAQVMTFLWKAAGSPQPSAKVSPFTDVDINSYYGKAVLWAVEKGITSGMSETTFGSANTCTRAQIATFLYRNAGSPAAKEAGFTDVATDAYYADAVAWAAEKGITSGMSETTFGPENTCTRAQIVTFLYRSFSLQSHLL